MLASQTSNRCLNNPYSSKIMRRFCNSKNSQETIIDQFEKNHQEGQKTLEEVVKRLLPYFNLYSWVQ